MIKRLVPAAMILLGFAASLAISQDKGGKGRAPQGPGLTLTSPDIEDGAIIPEKFSMRGAGQNPASPKLEWSHVPAGTQSFVILLHDPDVSMQKKLDDVTHWMAFNIPGTATGLPASIPPDAKLPDGTIQIKNTMGRVGYVGPGMGPAGPYHHYTFALYALDTKLDLPETATRADVMNAIEGHILGVGILEGRYHQ